MSALAVLDLGKTNAKLLVFSAEGRIVDAARAPSPSVVAEGLRTLDVAGIEAWARETLERMARAHPIERLMISTHGCAFALVRDGRLAAPILDYEQEIPADHVAAIDAASPPYAETFSPDLPGGLNFGRHLLLRERLSPGAVSGADAILCYPQYWVWRFCGALASEVSFLGCHSHLWDPRRGDFSSLVDRMGWRAKFPPLRPAGAPLGTMRLAGREVTVHNGVHDSNATLHLYASLGLARFALVSTGTWVVTFRPDCPLEALDPARDMLANVTVAGAPAPTARFMGGREFDLIADGARAAVTADDLAAAIAAGTTALPSFAPGGPFPGAAGRIVGPAPGSGAARAAVATLYVAAMTDLVLDLLRTGADEVLIDGGLAHNAAFSGLVAAARPGRRVRVNTDPEGTAMGAAALAFAAAGRPGVVAVDLAEVRPAEIAGWPAYRDAWRARVGAPGG